MPAIGPGPGPTESAGRLPDGGAGVAKWASVTAAELKTTVPSPTSEVGFVRLPETTLEGITSSEPKPPLWTELSAIVNDQ